MRKSRLDFKYRFYSISPGVRANKFAGAHLGMAREPKREVRYMLVPEGSRDVLNLLAIQKESACALELLCFEPLNGGDSESLARLPPKLASVSCVGSLKDLAKRVCGLGQFRPILDTFEMLSHCINGTSRGG